MLWRNRCEKHLQTVECITTLEIFLQLINDSNHYDELVIFLHWGVLGLGTAFYCNYPVLLVTQ